MTYEEVRKHFEEDRQNYPNKIPYFSKKFSSLILHSTSFPVRKEYFYTTPKTRNTYLFLFEAKKRGEWKTPKYRSVLLFNQKDGKYAITSVQILNQENFLMFSPHFWGRYRERVLKDQLIPTDDVIRLYFLRNSHFDYIDNSKDFSLAFEKYMADRETQYVFRVADGMCFGSAVYHRTVLVKTIVSRDMLYESQLEALDNDLPDALKKLC